MNALSDPNAPDSAHADTTRDPEAAERMRRTLLHARAKRLARRDRSGMLSRTRR